MIVYNQKKRLLPSNGQWHPNQSWDFEFVVPDYCTVDSASMKSHKPGSGPQDPFNASPLKFNYDLHQPLPPSFQDKTLDMMAEGSCSILHQLEARMATQTTTTTTTGNRQILLKADRKIDVITTRDVKLPDPRMARIGQWFERSSSIVNQGHDEHPASLKEKLRVMHKPKGHARFNLFLNYPSVAVIGEPFPLLFDLVHDTKHSNTDDFPTVTIRKISLSLVSGTNVRSTQNTMGFSLSLPTDAPAFHYWDHSAHIDEYSANSSKIFSLKHRSNGDTRESSLLPLLTSETFDLSSYLKCRIPPFTSPTFNTFNICHGHKFRVKVTVDCASKHFDREFLTKNVTLLPPVYKSSPSSSGGDIDGSFNTASSLSPELPRCSFIDNM